MADFCPDACCIVLTLLNVYARQLSQRHNKNPRRYENSTGNLVQPRVWWALRNGSADSINKRTIWSDAFGDAHLSIGSPCLEWAGNKDVCTPDTCICRDEYLDSTLTFDLQPCNMSGMLFELEAATFLSAANADVVVLLVFIGGWCYKLYELSKVCVAFLLSRMFFSACSVASLCRWQWWSTCRGSAATVDFTVFCFLRCSRRLQKPHRMR